MRLEVLAILIIALPICVIAADRLMFRWHLRSVSGLTHRGRWHSGYYIGFRGSVAADLSRRSDGLVRIIVHFSKLQLMKVRGQTWALEFTPSSSPDHPPIAALRGGDSSFYCRTELGQHVWLSLDDAVGSLGMTFHYGAIRPKDAGQGWLHPI